VSKRAERRHHYYRLKKKRSSYYGGIAKSFEKDDMQRALGMYVATATLCSCSGCGNPRKHHKEITTQEYKAELVYADGIEEYFGWRPHIKEYNCYW